MRCQSLFLRPHWLSAVPVSQGAKEITTYDLGIEALDLSVLLVGASEVSEVAHGRRAVGQLVVNAAEVFCGKYPNARQKLLPGSIIDKSTAMKHKVSRLPRMVLLGKLQPGRNEGVGGKVQKQQKAAARVRTHPMMRVGPGAKRQHAKTNCCQEVIT